MKAYDIYDGAYDTAQEEWWENTVDYIQRYAENALNIHISEELAQKILDCRLAWLKVVEEEGGSTNAFFYTVGQPLKAIEIDQE